MLKRIQRSRKHKLPANTKCVSRPSKFANPFFIFENNLCIKSNLRDKEKNFQCLLMPVPDGKKERHELLTGLYRDLLNGRKLYGIENRIDVTELCFEVYVPTLEEIKEELSGYDFLACWCGLDLPCHVDVLVEKLNR